MKHEEAEQARERFAGRHPASNEDNKAIQFYHQLRIDSVASERPNIAFIVVAHLVHSLPYFSEALSFFGNIAVIIPKSSHYVENVVNSIKTIYEHSLCLETINKETLKDVQVTGAFLETLTTDLAGYQFIIIDHGGYFANNMTILENFSTLLLGIVEHTWNGEMRYRNFLKDNKYFPIPVYSIAHLKLKAYENIPIARSIITAIESNIFGGAGIARAITCQNIGIIGYGNMGRALAFELIKKNKKLIIFDSDKVARDLARADLNEHTTDISVVENNATLFEQSDLIIVATSGHALTKEEVPKLKNNVCLVCVTSKDDLIAKDAFDGYEKEVSENNATTLRHSHSA